MPSCPRCRERMTPGFLYAPDSGARIKWVDGEPSWKTMLGLGGKATDLTARRCTACGYVEFFADPGGKPVDTMASVVEENEQLRRQLARLGERLATVEAIAVDPGARTMREIEQLRSRDDDPAR